MRFRLLLAPAALLACNSGSEGSGAALPPPSTAVRVDAGTPRAVDAGVTALPSFDPGSGFHLDDTPVTRPAGGRAPRDLRPVQILLRSTPPSAIAAVDGVRLGPTPVLWEGMLDGLPHEFTFVMAGHSLARYRFVPVTSGIVHGTLVKLTDDKGAGVPEIPPVAPPANRTRSGNGSTGAIERPSPPPVDAAPPPPVDAAAPSSPFAPPP